jgi:hypothetical protein
MEVLFGFPKKQSKIEKSPVKSKCTDRSLFVLFAAVSGESLEIVAPRPSPGNAIFNYS